MHDCLLLDLSCMSSVLFGLFISQYSCFHCFHFYFKGHYLYTETSYPRKPGDNARLNSPIIKRSSSGCSLRFFYHMKGTHIGNLVVSDVYYIHFFPSLKLLLLPFKRRSSPEPDALETIDNKVVVFDVIRFGL